MDLLSPKRWVNETADIVQDNLMLAKLCHCDGSNGSASKGSRVNVSVPETFGRGVRAATVELDFYRHLDLVIPEEKADVTTEKLVKDYLESDALELASQLEHYIAQRINAQAAQQLPEMRKDPEKCLLAICDLFNKNGAPSTDRILILNSKSEVAFVESGLWRLSSELGFSSCVMSNLPLGCDLLAWHKDALVLATRTSYPLLSHHRHCWTKFSDMVLTATTDLDAQCDGMATTKIELLAGIAILEPSLVVAAH
jgi:hypothetical protein